MLRPLLVGLALVCCSLGCPTTEVCDDGVDNNGDGKSDCADPACASNALTRFWASLPSNS